jgi:hypothetical protein
VYVPLRMPPTAGLLAFSRDFTGDFGRFLAGLRALARAALRSVFFLLREAFKGNQCGIPKAPYLFEHFNQFRDYLAA